MFLRGSSWIILFLLILSSCSTISNRSDIISESPLNFNEKVYDFGYAAPDSKIKHTFKFINNSNKPVKITNLSTSCGCTAAFSPENEILPGGTGEINATLETRKYEGEQEAENLNGVRS